MSNSTTTVQARVESDLKEEAEEILRDMGLTVSEGMRLFLKQVVNSNGLPFQPTAKKPRDITLAALKELRSGKGKRFATTAELFSDLRNPDESVGN